jgi:hypothetical protein
LEPGAMVSQPGLVPGLPFAHHGEQELAHVRIEVDGHYYDAIDDVVDPDVREFLFAMMREWEARH